MTKEKKAQRARRASSSEHSSNRGASKRPASSSKPPSQSSSKKMSPARKSKARKREDKNAQKRRKTEQAVRKASARTSKRSDSTRRKSSDQRTSSKKRTASTQQRTKNTSPTRAKGTSTRTKSASVRSTQNSPQRKRPAQGAGARKAQPATKRKPTAAEIRRRKRNRRLLLIILLLIIFLIAGLFTLYYVSHRIQDQTNAAVVDDSKSFAPIVCTPDIVEASMKADAPVDENSPVTFTVTLHNTSQKNPCYIDVGRAHTEVTITSGDALITSLSTCKDAGKENKQLLLDRNMTTSFALTWNRHRNEECLTDAPIASPGMYKAVWATNGDGAIDAEAVFEIEAPPEPEPTESVEGSEGEGKPAETPAEAPPANQ